MRCRLVFFFCVWRLVSMHGSMAITSGRESQSATVCAWDISKANDMILCQKKKKQTYLKLGIPERD